MKACSRLLAKAFLVLGLSSAAGTMAQTQPAYSQAELDQMLAPIALYPDTVLSHVMIAATYPLEVVQAARWSRENPGVNGQEAVALVEDMDWDASVKALVAFPELLDRMDRDLTWTQRVGEAFLAQEQQVLETIQSLRDQAYAQGSLRSNEQVRVVRETEYIYIEPARPNVVYVPYYDPYYVYGPWHWGHFPPHHWPYHSGFSLSFGYHWGIGYHIAPSFYFSGFHWPHYAVLIFDHHHYGYGGHGYGGDGYCGHGYRSHGYGGYGYDDDQRHAYRDNYREPYGDFKYGRDVASYEGERRWQHDPRHRRGVNYRVGIDANRFIQPSSAPAIAATEGAKPEVNANARYLGVQRDWAARKREDLQVAKFTAGPAAAKRAASESVRQRERQQALSQQSMNRDSAVKERGIKLPAKQAERTRERLAAANAALAARQETGPAKAEPVRRSGGMTSIPAPRGSVAAAPAGKAAGKTSGKEAQFRSGPRDAIAAAHNASSAVRNAERTRERLASATGSPRLDGQTSRSAPEKNSRSMSGWSSPAPARQSAPPTRSMPAARSAPPEYQAPQQYAAPSYRAKPESGHAAPDHKAAERHSAPSGRAAAHERGSGPRHSKHRD